MAKRAEDLERFGAYVNEVAGYAYPLLAGHIDIHIESAIWDYTWDLETTNAGEFIRINTPLINQALVTAEYNPFFFARKRLTVRVITGNHYVVTLKNSAAVGTPAWTYIFTRHTPNSLVVEPAYRVIKGKTLGGKPGEGQYLGDFGLGNCEPFSLNLQFRSGIFCPAPNGSGKGILYDVRKSNPQYCNIYEHNCDCFGFGIGDGAGLMQCDDPGKFDTLL